MLPSPSSELLVSVVLSVPGGGTTTAVGEVDVDDVVLDVVVCAKAAPVVASRTNALKINFLFIGFPTM